MQRNTGYFPTESLEPSGNRLFSRSALNEGDLFRGSQETRRGQGAPCHFYPCCKKAFEVYLYAPDESSVL